MMLGKILLGIAHALQVRQFCVERAPLIQHLAEQPRISRVVFDQENGLDGFIPH
jgi:hypothetical protein